MFLLLGLITDPARVYYSPTIQYLPLGLSGIVRCFIQASPPFQFVTWTKDRRPFDPNSTPGVVTLNNGSLLFHKVSHEHQGIYRCTPYNIHGSSEPSQGMEVLVRGELSFLFLVSSSSILYSVNNSKAKLNSNLHFNNNNKKFVVYNRFYRFYRWKKIK